MTGEDLKKFGELFITYVVDDKVNPCPSDLDEFKSLMKMARMDESYLERWDRYVTNKRERLGSDFERWYDSLEVIDDIPYEDQKFNNLPTQKREIRVGCEYRLMKELHNLAVEFYNSSTFRNSDDLVVRYRFWQGGVTVEYAYRKGMPATEARKRVIDSHKTFVDKAKSAVQKFNAENSEYQIQWTKSASPVMSFDEEYRGHTYVGVSMALTASVDVFRKDKMPVDGKYVHQLFTIVEDEQEKRG